MKLSTLSSPPTMRQSSPAIPRKHKPYIGLRQINNHSRQKDLQNAFSFAVFLSGFFEIYFGFCRIIFYRRAACLYISPLTVTPPELFRCLFRLVSSYLLLYNIYIGIFRYIWNLHLHRRIFRQYPSDTAMCAIAVFG